ncbi:Hypothetical protein AKI40_4537 [Enterobacter sp. FY-07]|nr:Hypothetical protein AKI40_4537 [Enterobacter sp. FY-07]
MKLKPDKYAGIAQLVEHDLAKVGVASSSLVSRSKFEMPKGTHHPDLLVPASKLAQISTRE